MPTYEEISALIEAAKERAATEVITYVPDTVGDHIAGIVKDLGTIRTRYGDYYTTTIEVVGLTTGLFPNDGGRKESADEFTGKLVRVAWMGAVLVSTYMRLRPGEDDLVAFHYQKDVTPQNGMNDYALITAVVLDGKTGKAKMPVDLTFPEVTAEDVSNADPNTGELPATSVGAPENGTSKKDRRVGVKPSEEPLRAGESAL
jgi:hypothetical protein